MKNVITENSEQKTSCLPAPCSTASNQEHFNIIIIIYVYIFVYTVYWDEIQDTGIR